MQDTPNSLPISALQHIIYCKRQCALIHLDQAWAENHFTAEGRAMHDRAHDGPDESRPNIRIARGLPIRSEKLSIHGICDVVEFHQDGQIIPVEYKRGKPKAHRADEVQLCAQALCLEETMDTSILKGFLFYGKPRRRTQVTFDAELRKLTMETATNLHYLIGISTLPPAVYEKNKCGACSLYDLCQPRATTSARQWFANQLQVNLNQTT